MDTFLQKQVAWHFSPSGFSLHIPCWLLSGEFLLNTLWWLHFYVGSFPSTSHASFILIRGVSLTHSMLASFFIWGVSLTHPVLALFLSGEILLHIWCWLGFYMGSFSHTSCAVLIFMQEVSLTHPVLAAFYFYWGSFCYSSRAGFILSWGVSLTHPMLDLLFCGEFLLHIPCLLLFLNLGSFSYTSRAGFIFMWGVSLQHPVLTSLLCGEFLLHIPCWLLFLI